MGCGTIPDKMENNASFIIDFPKKKYKSSSKNSTFLTGYEFKYKPTDNCVKLNAILDITIRWC